MMPQGSGTAVMSDAEAEEFVMMVLRKHGPMTTMQIESLASVEGRRCPDQTVLFLTKMKRKGLIRGEVSLERRGWLWQLP
jgi:hypothetical protein